MQPCGPRRVKVIKETKRAGWAGEFRRGLTSAGKCRQIRVLSLRTDSIISNLKEKRPLLYTGMQQSIPSCLGLIAGPRMVASVQLNTWMLRSGVNSVFVDTRWGIWHSSWSDESPCQSNLLSTFSSNNKACSCVLFLYSCQMRVQIFLWHIHWFYESKLLISFLRCRMLWSYGR